MRYSSLYRGGPGDNPFANALVIVVGTVIIIVSIVLGFFAFVVLGSIVAVLASILGIRVWWLKRKYERAANKGNPGPGKERDVIEGEFRVVADDREDA